MTGGRGWCGTGVWGWYVMLLFGVGSNISWYWSALELISICFNFHWTSFGSDIRFLKWTTSQSGPAINFSEPFGFGYFKLELLRFLVYRHKHTKQTGPIHMHFFMTWSAGGTGRLPPCSSDPFTGRLNSRRLAEFLVLLEFFFCYFCVAEGLT